MAYDYLDEKTLADALHDSEEYMRGFYSHIPELQRISRGKPGKVPQGKPRVTTGIMAAIRRETPKQIIQQLPSGRAIIHANEDMEDYANAILSDIILPNANSGGTPFSKSKRAIKSTFDVGSAWAECFFNRRGDIFYADYRLKYYTDVLFEKGKVSEFDANWMAVIDWMTEGDVKATIWREQQRKYTTSEWDLKALQEWLDKGPAQKDEANKTPEEKAQTGNDNGFFKIVKFYQIGVGATFYYYAPTIKKVVYTCTSNDPRGIMPVHGLVPEEDDDNPLGEPLARISAGKVNLADFDMQMYQYGQGMGYSPTLKKWGQTPVHKIKIAPDNVIELDGNKSTDDFEVVNIGNNATANFANNYGLIVSQIQSEMGNRNDTSVSSTSGNPGFSKTAAGVKQGMQVTNIANNDLRMSYELWQGRIYETLLNIQFAQSEGKKELQLQADTLKRLKLDKQPVLDYDKEYGKIQFHVNASTSQKLSDAEMIENMKNAEPLFTPQNAYYLSQIGWKLDSGEFQKAKLQRMNLDSLDKIMTKMDEKEAADAKKQPFPIIDPPQFRVQTDSLWPEAIAAILAQGGVSVQVPQSNGQMPAGLSAQAQADFIVENQKAQAAALSATANAHEKITPKEQGSKGIAESLSWKPGDFSQEELDQIKRAGGVTPDQSGNPSPNAIAQATDTAAKIDKHAQDTAIAQGKHVNSSVQPPEEPELVDNKREDALEPTNV